MDNRRAYLDTLNAGRQRRPDTTLEQLNRSLEQLENQLGRVKEPLAPTQVATQPPMRSTRPEPRRLDAPAHRPPSRGTLPQVVSDAGLSGELAALRDELRQQITLGLREEFETLRKDFEQTNSSASAKETARMGLEFERLSSAIQALAEQTDDRGVALLRLDVEQVKTVLETLAREETVLSVDRRWDAVDRRFDRFEERASAEEGPDPQIVALFEHLGQIHEAVNNLPESLSLRSLEEKVRTLAGAVDHFARQQDRVSHDAFDVIEQRLDEISRAIVASAVSSAQVPNLNPEAFERIEDRIAALAQQIEAGGEAHPTGEVLHQLSALARRVDEIAERSSRPDEMLEKLAGQIASVAERLANQPENPDAEPIFKGIEHRFDVLSEMFERRQGDALEQSAILLRDLERRLDEVAERLDRPAVGAVLDAGVMGVIDSRFQDLARQIEAGKPDPAGDDVIRGLETRLDSIVKRLDTSAKQTARLDPLLIESLQKQVAALSLQLSRPSETVPGADAISPRLDGIERSIEASRDTIVQAARLAAENAVASFAGSKSDKAAVAGLAEDLKALETMTRRSDERNVKTFEAIHDTLLKVVERLGAMDSAEPRPNVSVPEPKIAVDQAPSIDLDEPLPLVAEVAEASGPVLPSNGAAPARTPAEAAQEAAAALGGDRAEGGPATGRVRSLFGGLSRAFTSRKSPEPVVLAGSTAVLESAEAPAVSIEAPLDPRLVNRPLEPGSGTPDLNAILKRVRDERAQPADRNAGETGKADFIAAARRAAQAAAAESEIKKQRSAPARNGGIAKVGEVFKARRKPLLIATGIVLLALAGVQLGQALFSDPVEAMAKSPRRAAPSEAEAAPPAAEPARQVQDQAAEDDAADVTPEADPSDRSEPPQAAQIAPDAAIEAASTFLPVNPPPAADETPEPASAPAIEVPDEAGPVALREAAVAGDPKALFEIGSRYAEGRGVPADMAAAGLWYEKSAELGFAPAQYRIGNLFEKGMGVARDIDKAKTWYQLAAGQGNASGMHNLGVLFAMGAEGVADNDSAARWFAEAAELGVKDSQFNLGILAAKGVGLPQDLEQSYKWFALVAKTGDPDAAAKRDEIANSLRPEQLERARAEVELWKPKPLDEASNSVDVPDAWRESEDTTAGIDMGQAVQTVQAMLNESGYDAGGADGMMGEKTKAAILAFQQDNGLAATGAVDEPLMRVLLKRN